MPEDPLEPKRPILPAIVSGTIAAGAAFLVVNITAVAQSPGATIAQEWAEGPILSAALESPVIMLLLAVGAGVESFLLWGCIQTFSLTRLGSTFEIIQLEKMLDEKRYSEALSFCETRGRYYTRLVAAALGAMHRGRDAMDLAVDTAQASEERDGMDRIHDVGTLASLILLVGLLGLCLGAVDSLTALVEDRSRHLLLARSAFVPPAFACTVALPAYLMEAMYRRKLPQIHARVRHESGRIIGKIEL